MTQANTKTIEKFFSNVRKLGGVSVYEVSSGSSGVDILFSGKISKNNQQKIIEETLEKVDDNFSGTFEVDQFDYDDEFDESILTIKVEQSGTSGTTPTAKQEEGTTFILNQVLGKNVKYDSGKSILAHKETREGLEKIFGIYKDNLKEWAHTYYEQQKEFMKKFQSRKWQPFEYGGKDFVHFFSEQMDKVVETPEPIKPAGKYTTWNPSDIWAVYDKDKVVKEISKALDPARQSLVELNALILKLFKEKRLIGISLKKIGPNSSGTMKYVNIDTSTMKLGDVETYKMSDIQIELKNIMEEKLTTYIKYKGGQYSINVLKSGNSSVIGNLGFNTQIKGSAAQGGQVPVEILQEQLRKRTSGKVTFVNDHNKYPSNAEQFRKRSKEFEKYFNKVKLKIPGNPSYADFGKMILKLYNGNKKDIAAAKSKLMQLNFYHDAFISNKNNVEFWTDLLYFGMKMGKRFAPHIKIS